MNIEGECAQVKGESLPADNQGQMATRVNYADNLFFIMTMTRAIRSGLQLEIDPDYFRDKLVEDIFFIDRTLERIYEALRTNTYLINRRDHFRDLMRAKRNFADVLDELIDGRLAFSAQLEGFRAKLVGTRDQHVSDLSDIQKAMESGAPEEDQQTIISQDEYRFLFQKEEEDES